EVLRPELLPAGGRGHRTVNRPPSPAPPRGGGGVQRPQDLTRVGTMRNITRSGGIWRPAQRRSRRGSYFERKRATRSRRSELSARNSTRPWTVTPEIAPVAETLSATTHTRGSRRRLRTFCVRSTVIIVSDAGLCRNHIGIASGAPSRWSV